MDTFPVFEQSIDSDLEYVFDFAAKTSGKGTADYLQEDEVLVSHSISMAPGDLTEGTGVKASTHNTNSSKAVTVWLSGGVTNREYKITARITTSLGRVDERSMILWIKPT